MSRDRTRFRAAVAGGRREWYRITNVAADTVEILIYDEIGYAGWFFEDGVTASGLVRQLADIDAGNIRVRINSPGGDVFEAVAILNALRAHPARVTTVVDGIAASAASFVAMAGDEIVICRNAEMMIHEPSAVVMGDASDMRDMVEQLDRVGANIASMYADRAGGTVDEWRAAMTAETWYSDEEALAAGLVDRIERFGTPNRDDAVKNSFDLSGFTYPGRRAAPGPVAIRNLGAASAAPTSAEPVEDHPPKEETVDLSQEIRDRLGITDADVTDEALLEQLDAALEQPEPEPVSTVPDGAVVVDAVQLAELRAAAQAGVEARERQRADDRGRFLDAAIRDGKFPPARRAHYEALLAADPDGGREVINSLAAGLIPVNELGHSTSSEKSIEDAAYAALFGEGA